MATYLLLSTLNPGGLETLKARPDRLKEVNVEIERMGARVVAQYALLGDYDFLTIVEAADAIAIAKLSVNLGARGTVKIKTLPAIEIDEFIGALKS